MKYLIVTGLFTMAKSDVVMEIGSMEVENAVLDMDRVPRFQALFHK